MIKKSVFIMLAIIMLTFLSACSNAKPEKKQTVIPAVNNTAGSNALKDGYYFSESESDEQTSLFYHFEKNQLSVATYNSKGLMETLPKGSYTVDGNKIHLKDASGKTTAFTIMDERRIKSLFNLIFEFRSVEEPKHVVLAKTGSVAPVFEVGQYYDYIAKMKSGELYQLTVFVKADAVEGHLLLPKTEPLYLTGTFKDNALALYAKGPQQGTPPEFTGTLAVVDVLEGVFSASLSQIDDKPVKLTLSSMGYGTFGHRYDTIGTTEDAVVDAFVKTIQNAVKSNDVNAFASMVSYPITVAVSGKSTQIKTADSMIKNYHNIMNDNLKKTLEQSLMTQLFCDSQGVMFGSGSSNLWVTLVSEGDQFKLKIISINNKSQ